MLHMIRSWKKFSKPHRNAYGVWNGLMLALQYRKVWKAQKNELVSITVPDIAHPVWLRAGGSDEEVSKQIFVNKELNFPVVGNPKYIVDAGANIGLSAIWLANKFPDARIICLEVEKDNFEVLKRNVAPYPLVTPVLKGLWSKKAHLTITNPADSSWEFKVEEVAAPTPQTIEAVGVIDIIFEYDLPRIDVFKIDIEGSELEVLRNNSGLWLGKVGTLAIELHERFQPGCEKALLAATKDIPHLRSQCGEYEVLRFLQSQT